LAVIPGEWARRHVEVFSSRQVQPAGIDLTVDAIMRFEGEGVLEEEVKLPPAKPLPVEGGFIKLRQGAYKIRFNEVVEVPRDCVALAYPRSSLLRMGATICFAVWDPGYRGRGEALMLVFNPHGISVKKGSRVAQLVFIKMLEPPSKTYGGRYQYENL